MRFILSWYDDWVEYEIFVCQTRCKPYSSLEELSKTREESAMENNRFSLFCPTFIVIYLWQLHDS